MYNELLIVYESLSNSEVNKISLLANTSAFINEYIDKINWVGFYLNINNKLFLGPFQGKVACSVIDFGKGVCGSSFESMKTIVVDDVSIHPNHIYCDSNSKSEVVIPIIVNNHVYGVLDLDSPILNRFDNDLVIFLENIVTILTNKLIELK